MPFRRSLIDHHFKGTSTVCGIVRVFRKSRTDITVSRLLHFDLSQGKGLTGQNIPWHNLSRILLRDLDFWGDRQFEAGLMPEEN